MNTLLPRTLVAAAAVLAGTMQANAADTTSNVSYASPTAAAPIQVERVQLPSANAGDNNLMPRYITVSFKNEQAQPATNIVLGMLDSKGRVVDQYEQSGTFSPGVTIASHVPFDRILDKVSNFDVEAVTFADGTTWTKSENFSRRQSAF